MSETKKTPRDARGAPHFAVGPISRPIRRRAGALMMGTALTAIVGLGYGRGAYAQGVTPPGDLSTSNTTTVEITGPGTFTTADGFSVDTSGSNSNGVYSFTTGDGDTTFIDDFASSITGGSSGIYAENDGGGTLSISTTGRVTGNDGNGITAGTNSGSIDISVDGSTSGYGGYTGVYAYITDPAGGNLSISGSGNISGEFDAVGAFNYGAGYTKISVSGRLTSTGHGGVWAINKGTYLSIATGYVSAVGMGILAQNQGSGALEITANGDVSGLGNGSDNYGNVYAGINAQNSGTDLTITANNVTGGTYGIYADNDGTGALSITTTGAVTGTTDDGIYANNSTAGTDLTIVANTVTGGTDGDAIFARNDGSGALSITTTGTVTGIGRFDNAIDASNSDDGTNIIINAANVDSRGRAIDVDSRGSGYLSLIVSGSVYSEYSRGIEAENQDNGTFLSLSVQDVTAPRNDAIYALGRGSGDLIVSTTGNVSADGFSTGIRARVDQGSAGDVIVTANNVSADEKGIYIRNDGDGSSIVQTMGRVEGGRNSAIHVNNRNGNQVDLIIVANDVYRIGDEGSAVSDGHAIRADNNGSGAVSITTTGNVVDQYYSGIYARASGVGAADAVDLDGNSLEGVSLTITANNVTGGTTGIYADNDGTGSLSITANGAVTGGTGDGIYAYNASSEDTTITIAAGGSVSTSSTDTGDWAIEANAPNGAIIVNNFGTLTGRVNLSNSNTFTNSGTWDLANTTSDFNATGNSLVVNQGLIIAASDGAAEEWPWLNNLDVFRNEAGGTIRLADGATGDVFRIGNSEPPATANFVANGGTVELDVVLGGDGSATDRLDISGDVILDSAPTALAFTPVGGGTGGATDTGIEVVTVGGSSDAGAFVLAAPVEVGALAYDLSLGDCTDQADQNWYLCNSGTVSSTGAVFEAMPGVILNGFARTETLQQRLGARITGMPTTVSSRGTGDALVNQSVGPWVRTWGDFTDITPDQSSAGVSWQSDSWGFEAGIGTMLGNPAGGDLIAGVTLRYGSTFAQLDSVNGTGSIEANGFGIGASLTWFGTNGFYVDANGAIDFVSIDATSQVGGTLLDGHDDEVYSASIEIGQRVALAGGTTIVPQAQLSWGRMGSGQLTDELGNLVSLGDRETLTSRIGMTVEWDLAETELGAGQIYGFGNVLHDLSGSRTVTVAGTDVTQSGAGDWVELGGGFSLQPTETTNLFGQISYREAFDGVSGDAVAVSAGLRMQW